MIQPFETIFAVPLDCNECIDSVSKSIYELNGITKVDANLNNQLVLVEGTAAPSMIISAIQTTGRDAILRGSGKPNSAAVVILETFDDSASSPVRGLARIVQVSSTISIVDTGVRGLAAGRYSAAFHERGDVTDGMASTGAVWRRLGDFSVGDDGTGSAVFECDIKVWEIVGRSLVVSGGPGGKAVFGVVARSAGIWENEKTVCACSGQTIWEERKEVVGKGMM